MTALLFFGAAQAVARLLPRRTAYTLARPMSRWACRHQHTMREGLAANLRVVLDATGRPRSEPEVQALVQATYQNFGKYLVDFFQMKRLAPIELRAMVTVERIEYLEQCRGRGRGIIGLTAHIGSWEVGASVLTAHGCPVNAVALRQSSPALDALFQSRRAHRGIRVLPAEGATRATLARLGQDEFVALLADLDVAGGPPSIPFFGRPARLPKGPAVLAARGRAPILPAFVLRQPDDTFRFRAYPPILPEQTRSVDEIQRRICAVLEEVIAAHPDQWFAFDPRWPQPPDSSPA